MLPANNIYLSHDHMPLSKNGGKYSCVITLIVVQVHP